MRRVDGPEGAELHRAADPARDQSWFLFATTRAQLDALPVPARRHGGQARRCARWPARLGLAVADKPDSQDICFVPAGQLRRCGGAAAPRRAGAGRDRHRGRPVVGRHDGIARYTVGQAKRLGDGGAGGGERRVVVAPDAGAAARGRRAGATAAPTQVRLREVNWLAAPRRRCAATVKLRARERAAPGRGGADRRTAPDVRLDDPALPAPGQACVFYRRRPGAGRRLHPRGGVRRSKARGSAPGPRQGALPPAPLPGAGPLDLHPFRECLSLRRRAHLRRWNRSVSCKSY